MIHIIIALVSLLAGVVAVFKGSQRLLKIQLVSFAATLTTGVGLVVVSPNTLTHVCASGLVFSAVSVALYWTASQQLNALKSAE